MVRDYYWALVRQIPHLLNDSIGRVTNVLFVVGCGLAAFRSAREANAALGPAWWPLILVGGVLVVAMGRANHEYVGELRRNATDVTRQPPAPQTTNMYFGDVTNLFIRQIGTAATAITGVGPSPPVRVTRYVQHSRQQEELPFDDERR